MNEKSDEGDSREAGEQADDRPARRSGRETLGDFLRAQRRIAGLSLRQLADISSVSNAYLSQIERNLHKPSIEVLKSVAQGLNVSAETLLDQVGLFEDPVVRRDAEGRSRADTEGAIVADTRLTEEQRHALLAVYRSYVAQNAASADDAELDDDQ